MMRSPLICSGVVSLGLHMAIIATLLSSGATPGRKDSLPAVSYVELTQLWFPEERREETDLTLPRRSPPNPPIKALKTESEPARPAWPKSIIRKLPTPAMTKLSPESKQALTRSLVSAGNSNVASAAAVGSPTQERPPHPSSPATETGRKAGLLLIKERNGLVADSTASSMGKASLEATPVVAGNPPPTYPRIARRRGWEGDVLLMVQVAKTGQVLRVHIDRSSGHDILDQAALKAVRVWRFQAARLNYKPVKAEVMVTIRFEFQEP